MIVYSILAGVMGVALLALIVYTAVDKKGQEIKQKREGWGYGQRNLARVTWEMRRKLGIGYSSPLLVGRGRVGVRSSQTWICTCTTPSFRGTNRGARPLSHKTHVNMGKCQVVLTGFSTISIQNRNCICIPFLSRNWRSTTPRKQS
jgi:hypothetical protein